MTIATYDVGNVCSPCDPSDRRTAVPKGVDMKGIVKRIMAPIERRIEFVVARAVDQSMQQQSLEIQDALRADVATLVELTYELQHTVDRLNAAADHAPSA